MVDLKIRMMNLRILPTIRPLVMQADLVEDELTHVV